MCDGFGDHAAFVIDGELCHYKRSAEWADIKENPAEEVEKEFKSFVMAFTAVLLVQDPMTDQQFVDFIDDIKNQTVKPTQIIVVLCHKEYPKRTFMNEKLNEWGTNWFINMSPSREVLTSMDDIIDRCHSVYYTIFNVGDRIASDFYEKFNNLVKNRVKFLAIEPINDKYSYMSIMRYSHKRFGGNKMAETTKEYGEIKRVDFILDKIKFICQENNESYLVKTNQEVGLLE